MSEFVQRNWSLEILSRLCATAIVLAAIPTLFVPLDAAMHNWSELSVSAAQLAALLAPAFALLAIGLAVAGAGAVAAFGERVLAGAVALLLAVWLQSSWLVWDYGAFDGSPIDWGRHTGVAVLEAAVWLALLGIAALRPAWLSRRALTVAGTVLLIQLGATIANYAAQRPFEAHTGRAAGAELAAEQRASLRAMTELSSTRNVIVIVLDTLQSDFFAELLLQPDFAARVPPGFTYFRNAVAGYPHTQHSLPSMLTSRRPRRQPSARWTLEQMKQSVPARLSERGWKSAVLTTTPPYLACNLVRFAFTCDSQRFFLAASRSDSKGDVAGVVDARALLRIGAFRSTPHVAKRWLYDSGRWRVPDPYPVEVLPDALDSRIWSESRRDLAVWRVLARDARLADEAPRFKLLHFFAAHHPSSIDARCEWNGLENPEPARRDETAKRDRRFAVDASQCSLSRAFDYLRRLEALGVYDDSLVFIVGDHGRAHSSVDLSTARPPIAGSAAARADRAAPLAQRSKGVPLILAKQIGARGALAISDAPVSLCDLPRSIFDELALGDDFDCSSIFALDAKSPRLRLHFRGMDDYQAPFRVYRVEGHSWLAESWRRQN